ncbi:hypothetical protein ACSAZL_13430 [Methanosarcina sp. T3]|uniref:hypothetical protein n=1 Tax=Methanosarcina sp. T3 TaxID=3439062 RepID=UPI003F84FBDA
MAELYSYLIQRKEGGELLDEVPRTPRERAEALTKAGIALVEVGKYEEGKECFAEAKELEDSNPDPKNSKSEKKVPFEEDYPHEYILE